MKYSVLACYFVRSNIFLGIKAFVLELILRQAQDLSPRTAIMCKYSLHFDYDQCDTRITENPAFVL